MTDHWGHLLPLPAPTPEAEAAEEPPQGGEVIADHEEPAQDEVAPSDEDMLRASRALLEAKRESILKLGAMRLGGAWVSYKVIYDIFCI